MNTAQRWRLKIERVLWRLDQPQALRMAIWFMPVVFGLLSIAVRQDSNWDLRNYHLYNPFAWLNGKVGLDLAPAQMQTYFNPTIDLLYYGLDKIAPPRVLGFVMGAIHGLNFVLLVAIARAVLPVARNGRQIRLPLCLAMAGMLGPGFIAQLGNTMGDNLTALFILGAVWLVLRHWEAFAQARGTAQVLLAGLVMGLGVGLKLTNGIYAPALCVALLLVPAAFAIRIRMAFLFGVGVLAGMAITAGHWFWKMWTLFGNPLYPQFNTLFHSPMAAATGIADLRFMPHDLVEKVLWPFIFAMHPERVSEIRLSMVAWPILYIAFIAFIFTTLRRHSAVAGTDVSERSRATALLAFFALSYLVWLNLFGIYRYLVLLELVTPLVVWLIAQRLFYRQLAGKVAGLLILLIVVSSVPSKNWGRVGWGKQTLRAEVTAIANPAQSLVLTVHVDPPMGWIATYYPPDLAFVSLVPGFESERYLQRVTEMMAQRSGPFYVLLSDSGAGVDSRMSAQRTQSGIARDAQINQDAGRVLAARGLQFAAAACVRHPAYVGNDRLYYRMCPVTPLASTPAGQP
jgi:hypothetical protein